MRALLALSTIAYCDLICDRIPRLFFPESHPSLFFESERFRRCAICVQQFLEIADIEDSEGSRFDHIVATYAKLETFLRTERNHLEPLIAREIPDSASAKFPFLEDLGFFAPVSMRLPAEVLPLVASDLSIGMAHKAVMIASFRFALPLWTLDDVFDLVCEMVRKYPNIPMKDLSIKRSGRKFGFRRWMSACRSLRSFAMTLLETELNFLLQFIVSQ